MPKVWYPKANRTLDFSKGRYAGSPMNPNCVVLHSTEGRGLPGYQGGATTPHFTVGWDFTKQEFWVEQHIRIDRSARALENDRGGVETNTLNCVQIEIEGTCDPTAHDKWSWEHVYMPDPPVGLLAGLAELIEWLEEQCGGKFQIRDGAPRGWREYPDSYGEKAPQRMSNAEWRGFYGICGHQHVPENSHGDPGDFPIDRLVALALHEADPDPADPTPLPADEAGTYTMRKDDTLYAVSRTHNVSVAELQAWNGITDPTSIPIGTVLRLTPPTDVDPDPDEPDEESTRPEQESGPPDVDVMDPDVYKTGSRGNHVLWVLDRLELHGIAVPTTDVYNDRVREAVQAFQLAQGWRGTKKGGDADGFPGPETLRRLALEPKVIVKPNPKPVETQPPPIDPETPPDTEKPPALFDVGFANLYMGYYYGEKGWTRAKEEKSAERWMDLRVSVCGIVEAHEERRMVHQWFKHIEDAKPQYRLHTGATRADGNALIWDAKKWDLLRDPTTINLPYARNLTWYNLRHEATGIPMWFVVGHLIAHAKAKRDAQMREWVERTAFAQRIIHLGDFNGYSLRTGPVPIARAAGLRDAYEFLGGENVVNGHMPTHPAGDEPGDNLDHIFLGPLANVHSLEIFDSRGLSDHHWLRGTFSVPA